ncbi:MAG: DNA-protecting protein DprA, partial [Alphaproteobacteria bacterium]|nr:DNA-protecting protein DprA [Alphaproteobacteria bacterium]
QGSTPQEPPNAQVPPDGPEMQAARLKIAESLSAAAITVDELVRECQLSAAVVQAVLLEFELAGHLERQPGGKVAAI